MNKQYAPHEPEEQVLSARDAFQDAEQSTVRWQTVAQERHVQPVLIELPEPMYQTLEELARRQNQTVSRLIEQTIEQLVLTFAPSKGVAP
ncbi:MAG: ribbon-helix-helix domain-containing protein [candidate division KSB1 bacterium]|nr:ribbon-helix-helix domain-containing protein [candidate division KSB1 bacterium]